MNIKEFIEELIHKGWKRKEIAEKCGYTVQHITRLLKHSEITKLETVERFAKAFDKPISFFLEEKDQETDKVLSRKEEILLELCDGDNSLLDEAIKCVEKEKLYQQVKKEKVA